MTETLITPDIIAKLALRQLKNNTVMAQQVNRQYRNDFVKVGDTVRIRRPVKFVVSDGATRVNQDVEENNTNIVVNKQKHVSWGFNSKDLTLSVEEFDERYVKPGMIALGNNVDSDLCGLYDDLYNWVGTPGQTINSFADFALAPERLDEMAVPMGQRRAVLSPADHWAIAGSQTGLFFDSVGQKAYRKGSIGTIANVDTFMDQNIVAHTVGVATGTPLVDGATQNVTYLNSTSETWSQQLVTDGWTNSTTDILLAGDVITIAGVNAVNPVPKEGVKQDAGFLQQFVVLADVDSGATTGPATLTISPPIITSGPQQTVTAAPADNAVITVLGTGGTAYKQNMAFDKNTFALVMVPLVMPDGVSFKSQANDDGFSVRVIKDYDIETDREVIRLDILYGVKTIYPDLGTRLSGSA